MKKSVYLFATILLLTFGCEQSKMPVEIQNSEQTEIHSLAKTTVNVPDDYGTIQAAVNVAVDGDVILIKEGVYKELVKINEKNNITLIGEDAVICPPDYIIDGEGFMNIDIYLSSNIKILNLKFDGKPDGKSYPIDRAINFVHSSGEASNNKIAGYNSGIACYNPSETDNMMNVIISNNNISDCYASGVILIGNFDVEIDHNIISLSVDPSLSFAHMFTDWHGILMSCGTGTISKNKTKLKSGMDFLTYSVGIRLRKRDPAPHLQGNTALHDVDVIQNNIKGTYFGIGVNSAEPFFDSEGNELDEAWCVYGVSLLENKFNHVVESYDIYNDCEEVVIID